MNDQSPTPPESPAAAACPPGQTTEEFERALRQLDEKQLWPMLLCIQQRLGSPQEQPADLDQVRAIAHRLGNILTTIRMKTDLALMKRNANLSGPSRCAGEFGHG